MGDKYSAGLQQTAITAVDGATGTDAVGELLGVVTVRGRIYDILFGHGSAPADTVIRWEVARATTSATGTAALEVPLDLDAPAADLLVEEEVTVGPTVTVDQQLIDMDLNQRATFRWIAAPDAEFMVPASATGAIFFNASSATYTGIARITVMWEE
jgi:hypothetical protein